MTAISLVCVFVAIFIKVSCNSLCPVSSSKDFSSHGDHYYPLDIFMPSLLNKTKVTSCDLKVNRILNVSCPTEFKGCPVIADNIADALASNKWKKSYSLCSLRNAWTTPNKISRVAIFGGSVTYGMDTRGCCSKDECYGHGSRCAWPHYLQKWLYSTYSANISVRSFASAGTSSHLMAITVRKRLFAAGFVNLSSSDLILLDHSTNDLGYGTNERHTTLTKGVELLIRRILEMSKNITDPPHIILLESETKRFQDSKPELSMSTVYRKYAAHYGLMLYSYRHAIESNNSHILQAVYHDWLDHAGSPHPPWAIHLFQSDLYAAILMTEFNECESWSESSVAPYVLPKPLGNIHDNITQCNHHVPPLLKISYDDIKLNTTIGSISIANPNTWQVRLDRKGRGGIIMELTNASRYEEVNEASVVFKSAVSVLNYGEFAGLTALHVTFMHSYINSGSVSIYLCGHHLLTTVDTLWPDYKTFRHTTPETIIIPLFKDTTPISCHSKDTLFIDIRYKISGYNGTNNVDQLLAMEPRTQQLVKIQSVKICQI